jgi:hypothetical protein
LKVQNIKGPHLSKFVRINLAVLLVFTLVYLLLFRLDSSITYNVSSELSHVWLYFGDLFSYVSSLALLFLINTYTYAITTYNSILAKFTSRPIDTGLPSSPAYSNNTVKATNYSPITITKRTNTNMSSESTLIRTLFALKGVADNTAISKAIADNRLDYVTDNSLLTILSDNHSVANKTVSGRSIFYLESNLLLKDYPTKFNKISANENTIKQLNLDYDLSSILESSTANALSRANANR